MHYTNRYLVFPEGDAQEIEHEPPFGVLVDVNGRPLPSVLPTHKMIAYRVFKVTRREGKGEDSVLFYLELVPAEELKQWARP